MERNHVQRIAALAIVTSLALGGAHPAAAATGSSFLDRPGSFWSVLTGAPGAAPAVRRTAVPHGAGRARRAKSAQTTLDNTEKGWGLDPNGNSVFAPLDPAGLP
jgi:hypothetical protein